MYLLLFRSDIKNPEDKEKWLIDEPAAKVVRKIFALCLAGKDPLQIARQLVVYNPVEDYQIIPNMQESIISKEQWLRVQEVRQHRRRPIATGGASLFSGLVFCQDCGAKLHFSAAKGIT